jgi:hypothetical protein
MVAFSPWFENLGKRLVKSPRGLARLGVLHHLLGIGDLTPFTSTLVWGELRDLPRTDAGRLASVTRTSTEHSGRRTDLPGARGTPLGF